jgi:hypothetical protein
MSKRYHKREKRMSKRMNKRGGYPGQQLIEKGEAAVQSGYDTISTNTANAKNAAMNQLTNIKNDIGNAASSTGSWWSSPGNWWSKNKPTWLGKFWGSSAPVQAPAAAPAPMQGGSRRRKRRGNRKSKNGLTTELMNMIGIKTKKRRHRGGIGGPSLGYQELAGSNFPSAANMQGNNIYDLAKFNPSQPMTGGKYTKRRKYKK